MIQENSVAELEKAVGPWPWRTQEIDATSGRPISRKMTLLLALAIFGGYDLFPSKDEQQERSAVDNIIKLAEKLGTLNKPDRARQYSRSDNEELLRSLNECWKTLRLNDIALRDRDKQIAELHTQLKDRDDVIAAQGEHLRTRNLVFWVTRVALGVLISAQWGVIGFLLHELLPRLAK